MYRASNMKSNADLELSLGCSSIDLNPLRNSFHMSCPELIHIEDDDDDVDGDCDNDVQVFSQMPSETIRFSGRFGPRTPVISDEDLKLRLGPPVSSGCRSDGPLSLFPDNKKQMGQASSSQQGIEVNQLKITCSICIDTMKEETSTVCGHVFCKTCITDAIKIQNKCPACREKLTLNSIHRIYLPGT